MDERRVQLYASVAEIVSAIAIVVSLIYVATEFRQSRTLNERDADAQLFARVGEANSILIGTPGIAEVVLAAADDAEQLTPADRLRYLAFQHQFFDGWELAWGYHSDGVLGDRLWDEWNAWFASRARELPAFAWSENRRNFSGAFRDHVDRALGFRDATMTASPETP